MFKRLKENLEFARFSLVHRRSLNAQKKWQLKNLRIITAHAYESVPMWRTIFDKAGVNPSSIRSLEDLTRLPITDKKIYLGKMAEEYTDSTSRSVSYWYVTSGTSGMPFTFLKSDHARERRYADFASLRFLWWRGEPFSYISTINYARIKIAATSNKHRLFTPVSRYLKDPRAELKLIEAFKPELLSTYPSLLLDIAKLVEKEPQYRPSTLRFVMSIGETLAPSVRSIVEKSLKCEVYDRYGLEEIGAVGVDCIKHDGFHINTESVIVEILDKDGKAVPEGEEGRVVVTNLFNYSMPFIRYESGDNGKISSKECACGLRSPRLWVRGRYSAYLTFPSRRIHHLEFDDAMDSFMNYVFQYQIAKISDNEIKARIIPGTAFHEKVPEMVEKSLRELVGPDMRISVEIAKKLPVMTAGKSRIVVDESVATANV